MSGVVGKWGKWVGQMLKGYDELPFGFYEWTLVGHLAIAAGRLGYYVLQEYPVERKVGAHNGPKRPRADLYVRTCRHDYVFEVKHVYIELGSGKTAVEKEIKEPLEQARNKLYRYSGAAKHRCSMVVASILMKPDDWENKYVNRNSYLRAHEKLADDLRCLLRNLRPSVANYCGGFLCSHKEARNEYKKGSRQGWNPIVGFVFLGRVKRSKSRRG